MSQVKLTLRPPPNVDFVHGYPGIPPGGPDRPQASVKGAIEVRLGQQGVKAKWVRIELRKIETLPGGGTSHTFSDFVGPSPVNLWTSSDEYSLLRTQDFPFSIRIPESIPPSIALENGAGIQYELVASVCTKGKKGFLRKRKSVVSSSKAEIIIDKHELHSTWPVYAQAESRSIAQEGVTLIVDRNQTCYGPGDRISVMATVKSDSLHTIILRGFEFSLRETTVYRAGHFTSKKAAPPQPRSVNVAESKLAVNTTLYGGTHHTAELACHLSLEHTTTSLNAARHIDITYMLCVKAIVITGEPLIMQLPVIISNWQRTISHEAIRRIGPAPSLSLLKATPPAQPITWVEVSPRTNAATLPVTRSRGPDMDLSNGVSRNTSATTYNSLPAGDAGYKGSPAMKADELGYGAGLGFGARPTHNHSTSASSNHIAEDSGSRPAAATSPTTNVGRRPNSAVSSSRFTITNALPSEIPQTESPTHSTSRERSGSGGGSPHGHWPTAEQEKQRLYEAARAKVEKVQASAAWVTPQTSAPRVTTPPPQATTPTQPTSKSNTSPSRSTPWPTAEEEKLRLFNQAQAAAKKNQADSYSPPSLHGRTTSEDRAVNLSRASSSSKPPGSRMTPAEIYSQGMSARNDHAVKQQQAATPNTTTSTPPRSSPKIPVPQYLTAEQEKAALKRYQEAKLAVDRVQNPTGYLSENGVTSVGGSDPIAYDSLYPHNATSSSAPGPNDLPPPFEAPAPGIPASVLSEKEKLRRAYEQQDAVALAKQNNASPPPFSHEVSIGNQMLSEKERLRRKFEAQDTEALGTTGRASPPQPPPRSMSSASRSPSATSRSQRPIPTQPSSPGRIMTAAEEKALLKSQYAAEESRAAKPRVNGNSPGRPSSSKPPSPSLSPPAPPPLMPRPPVEYIQETQEEDARVSHFAVSGVLPPLDGDLRKGSPMIGIDIQPFTPFAAGFGSDLPKIPGPPPPLPPKPEGE